MIKDWFWETAGFGEKSRLACCSLKRCRDQMIAAGKSKFWQIKLKEESNHLRIESKWAQFDLEPFILHLIEWHKKVISFSEWRYFQIQYPSVHQRPGASVMPLPAKKVPQESLSNEVVVMPLEDDLTKSEPNDNECFEVPVQVIPSTDVLT